MLCLQDGTGKSKAHLLGTVLQRKASGSDPAGLKCPWKALALSWADLGRIVLVSIELEVCSALLFESELCKRNQLWCLRCYLSLLLLTGDLFNRDMDKMNYDLDSLCGWSATPDLIFNMILPLLKAS